MPSSKEEVKKPAAEQPISAAPSLSKKIDNESNECSGMIASIVKQIAHGGALDTSLRSSRDPDQAHIEAFIRFLEKTHLDMRQAHSNTGSLKDSSEKLNDLQELSRLFREAKLILDSLSVNYSKLKIPVSGEKGKTQHFPEEQKRNLLPRLGEAYERLERINSEVTAIARRNKPGMTLEGMARSALYAPFVAASALRRQEPHQKHVEQQQKFYATSQKEAMEAYREEKENVRIEKHGQLDARKAERIRKDVSSPEISAYDDLRRKLVNLIALDRTGGKSSSETILIKSALYEAAQTIIKGADKEKEKLINLHNAGKIDADEMKKSMDLLSIALNDTAIILQDPTHPDAAKALQDLNKNLPKYEEKTSPQMKAAVCIMIAVGAVLFIAAVALAVNVFTGGAALPFTLGLLFTAKAAILPFLTTGAAWIHLGASIQGFFAGTFPHFCNVCNAYMTQHVYQPAGHAISSFASQLIQGFKALPLYQQLGCGLALLESSIIVYFGAKFTNMLILGNKRDQVGEKAAHARDSQKEAKEEAAAVRAQIQQAKKTGEAIVDEEGEVVAQTDIPDTEAIMKDKINGINDKIKKTLDLLEQQHPNLSLDNVKLVAAKIINLLNDDYSLLLESKRCPISKEELSTMEAESGKSFDDVFIEHEKTLEEHINELSRLLDLVPELHLNARKTPIILATIRAREIHKSITDEINDVIDAIKQVEAPSRK